MIYIWLKKINTYRRNNTSYVFSKSKSGYSTKILKVSNLPLGRKCKKKGINEQDIDLDDVDHIQNQN